MIAFFFTADSYLDVALNTIANYKDRFIELVQLDQKLTENNYGYQASSTIKSLLAFACECYMKSILIHNGLSMNKIKEYSHSLYKLFLDLDDDVAIKIVDIMKKNGYVTNDVDYLDNYHTFDSTDGFFLDLAENDNAFEEKKKKKKNKKNVNYDFLYEFALALRNVINKDYKLFSPFSSAIENNISKKH